VHWRTRLVARDGDPLPHLGARTITIPENPLGFVRAVDVRDPDGHALEVVEP
jgi:hypothetical protein